MNDREIFDAIDDIVEALYNFNHGNVDIASVEKALIMQGFAVDRDIHRTSKVQFLQNKAHQ